MNCLGFETLLADLLEAHPSDQLVAAARDHRVACKNCAQLWETVQAESNSSLDSHLTRSILMGTSGLPCGKVRAVLAGATSTQSHKCLSLHMTHCSNCRLWALWMAWQRTPSVSPDNPGSIKLAQRIVGLFERLLRRPRFGLEAAYAGTLLFFLLLGGPLQWSDTLRSVSRIAQQHPRVVPVSQLIGSSRTRISSQFETVQSALSSELKTRRDAFGGALMTVDQSVGDVYSAVSHVTSQLFSKVNHLLAPRHLSPTSSLESSQVLGVRK